LASLEEKGLIGVNITIDNNLHVISTITQNVDILHSKGGMKHVLHLHGKGNIVRCMKCGNTRDRTLYHDELSELNQKWIKRISERPPNDSDDSRLRPDGDAELSINSYDEFRLPGCQSCGDSGIIKTDVVFFGDSIPRHQVDLANAAVDAADGLLCIGTSLAVHSAFRLAKRAVQRGVPVAVLNVGHTRAEKEELDITKIESPIGETLQELVGIIEKCK
jgi:NAD-dependent deacetylase sirtuin 4